MSVYRFILKNGAAFDVELEERPRMIAQQSGRPILNLGQGANALVYVDGNEVAAILEVRPTSTVRKPQPRSVPHTLQSGP